jgi:hypothetical protein
MRLEGERQLRLETIFEVRTGTRVPGTYIEEFCPTHPSSHSGHSQYYCHKNDPIETRTLLVFSYVILYRYL